MIDYKNNEPKEKPTLWDIIGVIGFVAMVFILANLENIMGALK